MPADALDHVPPISRMDDAMALGVDFRPVKIPCCGECNNLAGIALHVNFMDRYDYVKARLAKRYAKQLRVVTWTEADLEEMGPKLRRSILHDMRAKAFVESRINFHPK
jgi:hypothetical protein